MSHTETRPKKRKPFWYRMFIGECPMCGHDASYRERVNGKKPRDFRKRYVYLTDKQAYDHCIG